MITDNGLTWLIQTKTQLQKSDLVMYWGSKTAAMFF